MAASSEKGVIRAQALAKHYDAKVAVQDVSLSLQGGEVGDGAARVHGRRASSP